jgi:hypothetical protein
MESSAKSVLWLTLTHRKETGEDNFLPDISVQTPNDRNREKQDQNVRNDVQGGVRSVELFSADAVF